MSRLTAYPDQAQFHMEWPVILAPMTGVTDLPFRRLVKRLAPAGGLRDDRQPGHDPREPTLAADGVN